MSRVQLALNVTNLEASIAFYSDLFGVAAAKVKPGYANFVVADPPLKLVLMEGESGGSINHLGVGVTSSEQVDSATARFTDLGFATDIEQQNTCCYAVQDKVWVTAPDQERWEVYTVLEDAESFSGDGTMCCTPTAVTMGTSSESACC